MSLLNRALDAGRRLADARMTETVEAGVFTDGVAPDGSPTRVLVDERYTGKARVKYESLAVSESDNTSQLVATQTPFASIPTGSARLFEGDELHVTASTADGLLVGRKYTVAGSAQAGQTTAHRYPLKELS
ncbi:DUF6093 family protein [Microbacterium sp. LWH12-1.2]|uniref:DUF6093 family protein n=1 Tax=Microbacterium sp. LWH12-1.2 TaxID=3135259 RepID=UPI0034480C87